jgi:hypothetical protein
LYSFRADDVADVQDVDIRSEAGCEAAGNPLVA